MGGSAEVGSEPQLKATDNGKFLIKYLIHNNKVVFDQVLIQPSKIIRNHISCSAKKLQVTCSRISWAWTQFLFKLYAKLRKNHSQAK